MVELTGEDIRDLEEGARRQGAEDLVGTSDNFSVSGRLAASCRLSEPSVVKRCGQSHRTYTLCMCMYVYDTYVHMFVERDVYSVHAKAKP